MLEFDKINKGDIIYDSFSDMSIRVDVILKTRIKCTPLESKDNIALDKDGYITYTKNDFIILRKNPPTKSK